MPNRIARFGLAAALTCGVLAATTSVAVAGESQAYVPSAGDSVTLAFGSKCATDRDRNVSLQPCQSGWGAQMWRLIQLDAGEPALDFILMNRSNGNLMKMDDTFRANVTAVDPNDYSDADKWRFTENLFYPGSYKIRNLPVAKWLGADSAGNVQGLDDHMTWKVTKV